MLVLGETLNSSSPSVRTALASRDERWIVGCARRQLEAGVDVLDCNAAALGARERTALGWMAEVLERTLSARLSLDSADYAALSELGANRLHPPILNAVPASPPWPTLIEQHVLDGAQLIVQLRQGRALPPDASTRLRWAEAALEGAHGRGFPLDRVLIDPVLLPWGNDQVAGAGLLEFVAEAARRWPRIRTVVGLSNVSWGFPDRARIHRTWLQALADRGLGAVLLNPFDPELMALARS